MFVEKKYLTNIRRTMITENLTDIRIQPEDIRRDFPVPGTKDEG